MNFKYNEEDRVSVTCYDPPLTGTVVAKEYRDQRKYYLISFDDDADYDRWFFARDLKICS